MSWLAGDTARMRQEGACKAGAACTCHTGKRLLQVHRQFAPACGWPASPTWRFTGAEQHQQLALMYSRIMERRRASMSEGWSPTGTRVMPGRSTSVMVLRGGHQAAYRQLEGSSWAARSSSWAAPKEPRRSSQQLAGSSRAAQAALSTSLPPCCACTAATAQPTPQPSACTHSTLGE